MKKTLIAMMALVGVATADTTSVLSDAYIGFSDFASGKADYGTQIDNITVSKTGAVTTLSGVTFDTASTTFENNSTNNNRDSFTITLVLDASKIGSVEEFTSLAAGYYSANGAIGIGVGADNNFRPQWGTDKYENNTMGSVPATGTITLTYAVGNVYADDTKSGGSRLYLNDETTFYTNTGLKSGGQTYSSIQINNLNNAVKQVYVHNRCLSASEVGTLMTEIKAIPEPTTATLSLLALAGLAARRRRK